MKRWRWVPGVYENFGDGEGGIGDGDSWGNSFGYDQRSVDGYGNGTPAPWHPEANVGDHYVQRSSAMCVKVPE